MTIVFIFFKKKNHTMEKEPPPLFIIKTRNMAKVEIQLLLDMILTPGHINILSLPLTDCNVTIEEQLTSDEEYNDASEQ